MDRKELANRLQPQVCYSVIELQDVLGIPVMEIVEAASQAKFARYLGEGPHMHLLGIDVQDWLQGKPAWRSAGESMRNADTINCRIPRQMQVF